MVNGLVIKSYFSVCGVVFVFTYLLVVFSFYMCFCFCLCFSVCFSVFGCVGVFVVVFVFL